MKKSEQYIQAALQNATPDQCWDWPMHCCEAGYGHVRVDGRTRRVNRVICERAHGPAPSPEHEAAHSCHRPPCCNPHHLSWKTRGQNEEDKKPNGTTSKGETHSKAKFTDEVVREIRRLRTKGLLIREVSERVGVSYSHTQQILANKVRTTA